MRKLLILGIGVLMLILASAPTLLAQESVQKWMEAQDAIFLPIVHNGQPGTVPPAQ